MAAMIFELPPQFGQWAISISKTRLSSLAQLMRAGAPCALARDRMRTRLLALPDWERFHCATLAPGRMGPSHPAPAAPAGALGSPAGNDHPHGSSRRPS